MGPAIKFKLLFEGFFFIFFQPHFRMICLVNLGEDILLEVLNEVDHVDLEEVEALAVLDVQIQHLKETLEVSYF